MIISPPFLPARAADQSDNDWIDVAMAGGQPGDGAYPVSHNLAWHGGMHLTAPMNATETAPLPVRAIANGTVVYLRQPTAPSSDPDHALNYGGGWTSDGVVVLRHETEIGEGATAQVTFFSVYMHLSSVHAGVTLNRPLYRKAEIGAAGQIYGSTEHKIHLEIICDDTHLARLVGRASGELDTTANGRTNALFGEVYVKVPSGASIYATRPAANITQPTAAAAHTTTEDLFIGIRYAGGVGIAGNRADAYVTTYRANGTNVGNTLEEDAAEYRLYTDSRDISNAHPVTGRPAMSAVYELLRFGRTIYTTTTLTPATTPHWRRVNYPGGAGWVNLNATGTTKFSDADFPHWRGWALVDDSTDQDGRCDSATIRGWLDTDGNGEIPPAEATARLTDQAIAAKMARTICKFPTEWDVGTFDARWGWLKTQTPENPTAMSDEDFELLRAHFTALSFWQLANLRTGSDANAAALPATHWRFSPREFVKWFRHCGWLSSRELAHCIPRTSLGNAGTNNVNLTWAQALQRAGNRAATVNMLFMKYLGPGRQRQTHALAQIYIETGLLGVMTEGGQGQTYAYGAFYGRGLMQLTWPFNYAGYGSYRKLPDQTGTATYVDSRITATSTHLWESGGTNQQWGPRYDPHVVGTQVQHSAESGGYFWVSKTFRSTRNINRACDLGLGVNHVGFISWLVNGGGNGYRQRHQYARYVANILLDEVPRTGTEEWAYPPLVPALTATFPPGSPANTQTVTVNYAPQVP
ncbi:M23 family metallopeptidase [Pyxidicoccus caerfyrddinensis]|uniref:M23 family metallopeptidase n=1 Tax=Pyxidicoccus caerfyrddinensis TaxID=2709663 RepID=UPI0013DA29A4|nr:M23 family metallopeptidase [Pyxidicoccus caerfyrddinensis]